MDSGQPGKEKGTYQGLDSCLTPLIPFIDPEVDFWTAPSRRENTSPNIAASICGCSWYLALNYMSIGQIAEARALILNGCFLQQCYNRPVEEVSQSLVLVRHKTHLKQFR